MEDRLSQEARLELLRESEESLRKHGSILNECAGCASTYRAHRDPDFFDPWCSTECAERHAER